MPTFSSADDALLQDTGRKVARLEAQMEGVTERLAELKDGQTAQGATLDNVLAEVRNPNGRSTRLKLSAGAWSAVVAVVSTLGLIGVALIT